jgi:mono/diheme cytochrome c family protein
MADKPALGAAISDREAWNVTAYLIAITPDLTRSSKQRRRQIAARAGAAAVPAANAAVPDLALARRTFEAKCSQCHELDDVEKNPPRSKAAAAELVKRMVDDNDAVLSPDEISLITAWLAAHYIDGQR